MVCEERSIASANRCERDSERTGIENNWFALTGRVVDLKVEMDGDLHIALQDATGDKPGTVVCEVPVKPQWCDIRETVFGGRARDCRFRLDLLEGLKSLIPLS